MNSDGIEFNEYNSFCKDLREGTVLYNMVSTNQWGEYLLVANVTPIKVNDTKTYTVLLLGLKKIDGQYIPRNLSISLTPDYVSYVPFLKPIGYCKFNLIPVLEEVNIKAGLAAVYSNTDLHKFASKLSIRKPRNHKYDRDGKPVIKKPSNK